MTESNKVASPAASTPVTVSDAARVPSDKTLRTLVLQIADMKPQYEENVVAGMNLLRNAFAATTAGAQRLETTSENIARDIREGRFPQRSEPQMVSAASSATAPLTSDSEADPRILAEQWHGRFLNKCGYPPDAEDGYASGYRDGLARAQSTNGEQS